MSAGVQSKLKDGQAREDESMSRQTKITSLNDYIGRMMSVLSGIRKNENDFRTVPVQDAKTKF